MAVVQPEILHPNKSVREVEAGRDGIGREIGGFRANRRGGGKRNWRRRVRRNMMGRGRRHVRRRRLIRRGRKSERGWRGMTRRGRGSNKWKS